MLKTVKNLIDLMGEQKRPLYISLVLSVFDGGLMIIPLLAAYQITARMPEFNHAVKTPLTSREIMAYTAMMTGCIIIRIILRYFTLRFRGGAGYKCMCSERKALGKELRKVSLGFLNEKNSGDLVSTITSDAAFLEIEGMGVVEKIAVGIPTANSNQQRRNDQPDRLAERGRKILNQSDA